MTSWQQAAKKEGLEKFLLESVDAAKHPVNIFAAEEASKEEKGKKVRRYLYISRFCSLPVHAPSSSINGRKRTADKKLANDGGEES